MIHHVFQGLKTASGNGPLLWNKLLRAIKRLRSINSLRPNVKNNCLTKMDNTGQ